MNLFANVKHGDFINEHNNFYTFGNSMMLLFRSSTGESFNGIMHDCMIQAPYCDPDTNCGSPELAVIYFLMFFTLQAYAMLELCTAIILDNFGDTTALADAEVNDDHMESFQTAWSVYDYNADNWIMADKLVEVMLDTLYPLGLKDTPGIMHRSSLRQHAKKVLKDVKIPSRGGQINFQETLQVLMARANKTSEKHDPIVLPPKEHKKLHKQMEGAKKRQLKRRATEISDPEFMKKHQASIVIVSFFRGIVARKKSTFWNDLAKRVKDAGKKGAEEKPAATNDDAPSKSADEQKEADV